MRNHAILKGSKDPKLLISVFLCAELGVGRVEFSYFLKLQNCSGVTGKCFSANFTGNIAPILPAHVYRILLAQRRAFNELNESIN